MNNDSPDPILVLICIVVGILLLPLGLLALVIYLLCKIVKSASEDAARAQKQQREAKALAALPVSSRKELGPDACRIELAPDGAQVFTHFPTHPDHAYRLQFVGLVDAEGSVGEDGVTYSASMDACYKKNGDGNFAIPIQSSGATRGLHIDGKPLNKVPHDVVLEDRELHRYEILVDGTGKKMAFAFDTNCRYYSGRFTLDVAKCDASVLPLHARAAMAASRKEAEDLAAAIELIAVESSLDKNWSDPAFVSAAAKSRGAQILTTRPELQKRLRALHQDRRLVKHLEAQHPELLQRLLGPMQAYLLAERASVEANTAVLRKRKRTQEEVRAYLVRGEQMVAEDERAVLAAVAEAYQRRAQTLRDKGLDEDEIESVLGTLPAALKDAADRIAARKGDGNVALQKLG